MRISGPTHEEIVTGDFVRLASGSPIGLVSHRVGEQAAVTFLTADPIRMTADFRCFRQAASRLPWKGFDRWPSPAS